MQMRQKRRNQEVVFQNQRIDARDLGFDFAASKSVSIFCGSAFFERNPARRNFLARRAL